MSKLLKGFHAEISFGLSRNNEAFVRKTFGKLYQLPSTRLVTQLIRREKEYQAKALRIGIPIVPSQLYYSMPTKGTSHVYIELQKYMKYNFHDALLDAKTSDVLLVLLAQYLGSLQKSWKSDFLISLDPVARNFGIDEDGVVRYFDFFPPRQKIAHGVSFEWPEPTPQAREVIFARYFTFQQAQVIYSQLLRVLGIERVLSLDQVKHIIGDYLGAHAYRSIDISLMLQEKILTSPEVGDADAIRIIAAEKYYRSEISRKSLEMIYSLTHIGQDNCLPSQKNVDIAALMVSQKLRDEQRFDLIV